jgi:hypothetical protein
MANKSAKEMTTNFTDVDVSRLSFTDLEDNQRSKGQKIAYPRYNDPVQGTDSTLFIQFPWVHLNQYGIPRIGDYYKDDSQRSFIKLPLDQSIPEIKQFSELLQAIDAKLGSDETKNKFFDSKASKYEYQPIFRLPQEEDEDDSKKDSKKDNGPKHPYMKLKIDTTFPDNHVKSIVFTSVMEGGKRVRTKVNDIKTIDDIASHICFLSRVRPIGRPVKLWAQTKPSGSSKTMGYGLAFKMAKVEVEPPSKANSQVKQYMESDAFLDSDEESDTIETVPPTKPVAKQTTPAPQPSKGKQVAQVASDSEEESGDESEEEVVKPATKQATKSTKAAVVQSDDEESEEESDEEDVKPAKKPASKPAPAPAKSTGKTKKASN